MNRDMTIDPREVEFYSRLADTWWDRTGPFWPLHTLNELRVRYIVDRICEHFGRDAAADRPLEGLRVLDVGCGGGILSESIAERGATVTGIDVVEKNIRVASLHAEQQDFSIDYRAATASELASSGRRFDVVLNMEVVEHVADVYAFMADCCSLTADDGLLFIATINRTPLSWLFAIAGAEYILRWLPKGTHRWSLFRKPAEVETMLRANGLSVADIRGVAVNPLARSMRVVSNTAVNYMLAAKRSSS